MPPWFAARRRLQAWMDFEDPKIVCDGELTHDRWPLAPLALNCQLLELLHRPLGAVFIEEDQLRVSKKSLSLTEYQNNMDAVKLNETWAEALPSGSPIFCDHKAVCQATGPSRVMPCAASKVGFGATTDPLWPPARVRYEVRKRKLPMTTRCAAPW